MQDATFFANISTKTGVAAQNGQIGATNSNISVEKSVQSSSIFNDKKSSSADVNQSNSNSQGFGGVVNIFSQSAELPAGFDNTSIFSGMNRGSQYTLYSKKDTTFDIPKLTQNDIANQKTATGPRRTNPKADKIEIIPKENPYAAFKNPEYQESAFSESIVNAITGIFGNKKAD